jgi:hypothetical protein
MVQGVGCPSLLTKGRPKPAGYASNRRAFLLTARHSVDYLFCIRDVDRFKLLGSYHTLRLPLGRRLTCEGCDVIVVGYSGGCFPWPKGCLPGFGPNGFITVVDGPTPFVGSLTWQSVLVRRDTACCQQGTESARRRDEGHWHTEVTAGTRGERLICRSQCQGRSMRVDSGMQRTDRARIPGQVAQTARRRGDAPEPNWKATKRIGVGEDAGGSCPSTGSRSQRPQGPRASNSGRRSSRFCSPFLTGQAVVISGIACKRIPLPVSSSTSSIMRGVTNSF